MSYPWNIRVDVGGVTFTGPGMETQAQAEAVKTKVEASADIQNVEVFAQR